MLKKITANTISNIVAILILFAVIMVMVNQTILSFATFGVIIVLCFIGMNMKNKEIMQYRKKTYERYQIIGNLTLKELVEDSKKSAGIDGVSINYLRDIIEENEGEQ